MATQTCYPGTVATEDSGFGLTWSNPNNIKLSDNSFATSYAGDYYLVADNIVATNFGFSVPTGATINYIEVKIRCYTNGSDFYFTSTNLIHSGNFYGSDISDTTIPTSNSDVIASGTDGVLWGKTWAASEINDSSFGFLFSFYTNEDFGTVYIDYISITVDYTESSGGGSAIKSVNGLAKASVKSVNGLAIASVKSINGLA